MKLGNGYSHLFFTAITDFQRNKIRTFLTSLGIMIGVLSVVMLIALGLGLKNYLQQQFENLGANLIMIFPGNVFSSEGGIGGGFGSGLIGGAKLDEKDLITLKRSVKADYIVPVFFKSIAVKVKTTKVLANVQGSSEDVFSILNLEMLAGQAFERSDVQKRSKKVVLGYSIAEKLYSEPEKALNKTLRIDNQSFIIIGVTKKKGDPDMDNGLIMPYTTTFTKLNPDKNFFSIYLGVTDKQDIPAVKDQAKKALLRRYEEDDFSVTEQSEILSTVNQIFSIVNGILIAIGSISLLVGGIGIMNIMYASVTERTKEIGIRRAIGATKKDILLQFLIESVVLSVFGGLVGLLLSIILVIIIRFFFPASISFLAVAIALIVSSVIGIFFGVFPARRAAKLPPIEAIRYE